MKKLVHSRSFYIACAVAVITATVLMMFGVGQNEPDPQVTTAVETGAVRQLVSVSGIAEAKQIATLAFPTAGIVKKVNVKKGDAVTAGDILIELDRDALLADRQNAVSQVTQAVSTRDELVAGPTDSARGVTTQTLTQAQESFETIRSNEARKIENAYQTLLSGGLTVYSNDPNEDAVPPTVSGSYTCTEEGTYRLELYGSSAQSGYSYYLTGIESGTFPASTQQAIALGNCGLRIIFDTDSNYSRTVWFVDIPNQKSPVYVQNRNAYALSVTQAESAIANAQQVVTLAQANATNNNAAPRSEALVRANAAISQAQAQLAKIDATIRDRVLRAPFSGTVTEIDVLPGETVTSAPVLTLLGGSNFEITARIPEIDIGKLLTGQTAELVFDARSTEVLTGTVDYISLEATEIDGVAYYEAVIVLPETPTWLRSGLNADIDIITEESLGNLRIPARFLINSETGYQVLTQQADNQTSTTTIELILEGNDGYAAITGLTEGDILVAP
jgi:RND family efflux transporter MFP subunit